MSKSSQPLSLIFNPIQTFEILCKLSAQFLKKSLIFAQKHWLNVLLVIIALTVPRQIKGPHSKYVNEIEAILLFGLWWVGLGVASSIGLGTGLHTFVLYLGPHIAKVTMVAKECNAIPKMLPTRWDFQTFDVCPTRIKHDITFFDILCAVQLESFLWGLGTALGELPPYYVARAAALGNQKNSEIDEVEQVINHSNKKTFLDKAKVIIYTNLKRHAFITVLLCASIPNPLFDLAGITCGHFLIPFSIFFTATFIGKAIIKVHIQMIFVIVTFTAHHVEQILRFLETNIPSLTGGLTKVFEKQKQMLHSPDQNNDSKHLVVVIWDYIILSMIVFFLYSIVSTLVNNYHIENRNNKKDKSPKQAKKDKKLVKQIIPAISGVELEQQTQKETQLIQKQVKLVADKPQQQEKLSPEQKDNKDKKTKKVAVVNDKVVIVQKQQLAEPEVIKPVQEKKKKLNKSQEQGVKSRANNPFSNFEQQDEYDSEPNNDVKANKNNQVQTRQQVKVDSAKTNNKIVKKPTEQPEKAKKTESKTKNQEQKQQPEKKIPKIEDEDGFVIITKNNKKQQKDEAEVPVKAVKKVYAEFQEVKQKPKKTENLTASTSQEKKVVKKDSPQIVEKSSKNQDEVIIIKPKQEEKAVEKAVQVKKEQKLVEKKSPSVVQPIEIKKKEQPKKKDEKK